MNTTCTSLQDKIDTLLQWCQENDIWIDPRLQLRYHHGSGIGVYLNEDYIPPDTSLVHIHKNSVLSVRNCLISDDITPVLSGPEAQLGLSLALYLEMLRGRSSRWFGYIQSLPDSIVDLPIFWSKDSSTSPQAKDSVAESELLRGTEVEKYLRRSDQDLQTINDYYFGTAEPLLLRHFKAQDILPAKNPDLHGFYYAYSLASSRAFLVDAFHGLSMVPIADAFNHVQENHVHLESDFDVCSHCGSLHECTHDDEDRHLDMHFRLAKTSSEAPHASSTEDFDLYYEMVSNAPVFPDSEVFNTYGESLTNSELLVRYGFILDANDNDRLNWDFESVFASLAPTGQRFLLPELQSLWASVTGHLTWTGMIEHFAESELVYYDAKSTSGTLSLNGDGKISYQLWVLLALPFLPGVSLGVIGDEPYDKVMEALKALLQFQLSQERRVEILDHGQDLDRHLSGDSPMSTALSHMANFVLKLCASRRAALGGSNDMSGEQDLHEIFDGLSENNHRARYALTIVMGEQSLLDSCMSAWQDILTLLK